jgi:hypothetical protein
MTTPRKPLSEQKITQPSQDYFSKVPQELHKRIFSPYFNRDYPSLASLSTTSQSFHSIYQPILKLEPLFQAVIDHEIEKVKDTLNITPELILEKPKLVIQSQRTWQTFAIHENILTVAVMRRQTEMILTLLPYFNKVQNQELAMKIKTNALSKWNSYENKENKGTFYIPPEYRTNLEEIIEIFKKETFPNGNLSDTTENRLKEFRSQLLPKNPMTLDTAIDPELFLYAASQIYDEYYDQLNDAQQSAYCRYIIGFLQSLLTPEEAAKWCHDIYEVVMEEEEISERGKSLTLISNKSREVSYGRSSISGPFYRESYDSPVGLGYTCYCEVDGRASTYTEAESLQPGNISSLLEALFKQKNDTIKELTPKSDTYQSTHSVTTPNPTQRSR